MPKVKVNGIQMFYEMKGEGFPLVMINGMNDNLDCWDPRLIGALSKKFKLILFDNRGAGRTDISDREYTIRLFADDIAGLMNTLGISRANVLGISMGGMIAQELAINYPRNVSKLILCSTSSQWNPNKEGSRILSAMERGCSIEELVETYLSFPFVKDYPIDFIRRDPTVVNAFTADFVKENPDLVNLYFQRAMNHLISVGASKRQFNAVKKFNTQGRLQKIKVPTLVLHGKKDFVFAPENGSNLAEGIPNAKLVHLQKSAHYLAEEMNEVVRVITEFLL
jgi:pimeloyl-ACP methyl ester carboxylesterase